MTEKITAEDFKKLRKSKVKAHKYGAIRCQRGEIKFPSKLERTFYDYLLERKRRQEFLFFLRQVPFFLPGNVKYVCDFVIFHNDSSVEFIDVKGKLTETYKMKKKMVEDIYPIKIIEMKKGDF